MNLRCKISIVAVFFAGFTPASAAPSSSTIERTEQALVEQISCKKRPQVAPAINAMLKNKLIRYQDDESGVYLFKPIVPLRFLGLPILHISGTDQDVAFRGVPPSRMVGTAAPQFLEIDVAAPASELKRRALAAGLVEAIPNKGKVGFEVADLGSYLAGRSGSVISSIECDG
jgi:hypothetical protein